MDLRKLRYFAAVARAGSFSKASSLVNITQPALSRQIRLLEEELGVTLFERASRGASLTGDGQKLLKGAGRIFAEIEATRQSLAEPTGDVQGTVVVGLSFSVAPAFATRLLRTVREKYPAVTLRLIEESFTGFGDEWLNWIRRNYFDLALLHSDRIYPDLDCTVLARENLCLIAKKAPSLNATDIPLRRLGEFPIATFPPDHPLRQLIESTSKDSNVALDVRIETDSWAEILDHIRQGRAYSINSMTALTEEARRSDLMACEIVEPTVSRQLLLVSSAFRQPTVAVNAVQRLLRTSTDDLITQGVLQCPDNSPARMVDERSFLA